MQLRLRNVNIREAVLRESILLHCNTTLQETRETIYFKLVD